ncbi:DUF4190 domain-containing protein [Streptomyces sp. NPDC101160]|uniref:DUF4190 domain-containing protein n=1 Tax=Streptomyces sp. NPDC101160 TaxID=3366118 RepID=UPI00381C678B
MSENHDQPVDPWAPPNQDGVELSKPAPATPPAPAPNDASVHNQQTVVSMPGAELPPPPVAPGGAFGYPTPTTPATSPAGAQQPGYGYPPASPYPSYGSSGYGSGYGQPGWGQPAPSNGMGTASMVLGIIAVAGFCMWGFGVLLGILALIFGIIGLKKASRGEATNRGMAMAGVVLGSVGILISAVFLALMIVAVVNAPEHSDSSYDDPFDTSLVVDAR